MAGTPECSLGFHEYGGIHLLLSGNVLGKACVELCAAICPWICSAVRTCGVDDDAVGIRGGAVEAAACGRPVMVRSRLATSSALTPCVAAGVVCSRVGCMNDCGGRVSGMSDGASGNGPVPYTCVSKSFMRLMCWSFGVLTCGVVASNGGGV